MSDKLTYELLEQAYQAAVVGKYPPSRIVVKGSSILMYRPDLVETIQPDRVYLVSHEVITKLPEDDG